MTHALPTIRRATEGDAELLATMGARWFADTFAAENDPEDMRLYLAEAFGLEKQRAQVADPARLCLLAVEKGELACYALLRGHAPREAPAGVPADGPSLEVERFYVAPEWQGRGLARSLMGEVIDFGWALGARTVWLGVWERNHRALRFYRKSGFREVGEQEFILGTDRQRDLVLALPIAERRDAGA